MGPKKTSMRSDSGTFVKDFGLLESLPYKPLSRADILGRYNGIRRVLSFTNPPLSENKTNAKLSSELVELYGICGI